MIISISEPQLTYYVETDHPDWPHHRRSGTDCWEQLMG